MDEKEIIQKIQSIGFTDKESKVFIALYKTDRVSATEISRLTHIKRPTVYVILNSLIEKGIVNEFKTVSKQEFEIIDRKIIEDKIIIAFEEEYNKKLKYTKECFNFLRPLYKKDVSDKHKPKIEIIKGYNRHRNEKFINLMKKSKESIFIMNRLHASISESLDKVTIQFIKKGGVIRSIYEAGRDMKMKTEKYKDKTTSVDEIIEHCKKFESLGEEIRLINDVPQPMMIFDEKIVLTILHDENIKYADSIDIIIANPRYGEAMSKFFYKMWDEAYTINDFKKNYGKIKTKRGISEF